MRNRSLAIILITVVIYIISKYPLTQTYSLFIAFLILISLSFYYIKLRKQGKNVLDNNNFVNLAIVFLINLVAATGWILSPFFYLLYILTIVFAYRFSTVTAITFIATIIVILTLSIAEVGILYTTLVQLSFLSVIPVILYLKKQKLSN